MNRQDVRSAVIAATVAALVAAPLAGADAVERLGRAIGGGSNARPARTHGGEFVAGAFRETTWPSRARRSRRTVRVRRGRTGATGAAGATGPAGAPIDPSTIRWRASSPFQQVVPADGAVRLVAECPAGTIAIDGGYVTGDDGSSIRVLGFERLTTGFDSREGYALTVRAFGGSGGWPQVRAYCS